MKHFTQGLLVAGLVALSAPVSAQVARQLAPRTTVAAKAQASFSASMTKAQAPAKAISVNPSEYGEIVNITTEDFSKMTTGSYEEPDLETDINYFNDDNAWINLSGDYTNDFGWGSHNAYPAGGCIFLNTTREGQAQINTPMLDVSGNDRVFFVKFRARTIGEDIYSENSLIEAAETNDMGPTWDLLGSYTIGKIDNEWRDYEFMFQNGGKTTLINICATDAPIYVDDIQVYQVNQFVHTPVPHGHRYYTGKTFNLHWDAVEGADNYKLNVYTVKGDGVTPNDYIVEDKTVEGTEFTVDNADSGDTYYYTVQAVKGEHISLPSDPVQIMDVETPTFNDDATITDGKLSASWNTVPTAERYNYQVAAKKVAQEDGEFEVSYLWMRGAQYPATVENADIIYWKDYADYHTYDRGYPIIHGQAGWRTTHYAIYHDALVLDGFWTTNGSDAGLISPEFDLSKDGGNITLDLRLAGEAYTALDQPYYPHCSVALFNYDKEKDDYVQDELVVIDGLTADWQDVTAKFTKGTEHTIIGVYATYTPTNLYIQSLKLKQNCKAGDYYYDPFYYGSFLEDNKVEVEVPYRYNGMDIYQQVQSVRVKKAAASQYESNEYLESKLSDYSCALTNVQTGVKETSVSLSGATVKVEAGKLVVNNPDKAAVYIYNAAGAVVDGDTTGASTVNFDIPAHGTYIVKAGNKSVKVTL